jgi:hypothetical protein
MEVMVRENKRGGFRLGLIESLARKRKAEIMQARLRALQLYHIQKKERRRHLRLRDLRTAQEPTRVPDRKYAHIH